MYLFFDTETTGLPNYSKELHDPAQPHVVQFAMILTDEKGKEISAFKTPIKPEGWAIDENGEAFKVHGITNELATKYGMSMKPVLYMFRKYQDAAILKVAHNYRFDGFILKSLHTRLEVDAGTDIDKYCTMKTMTDIMKIPPTERMQKAGFTSFKSPNLGECYEFCTGKKLENAHDALADVRAVKDVFFWILNNGHYKEQPRVNPKGAAA